MVANPLYLSGKHIKFGPLRIDAMMPFIYPTRQSEAILRSCGGTQRRASGLREQLKQHTFFFSILCLVEN